MNQWVMSYVPIVLSSVAIAGAGIIYYKLNRDLSEVMDDVKELRTDVNGLEIENRAFNDSTAEDEEDMFEKNVRDLAEKLFALLKTKHGVDDVTTYREMTDIIEEMDADDDQLKEELLNFYEAAIRLEYSDDELSEEEKERMKQTAIDLIKKTGQSLEGQE